MRSIPLLTLLLSLQAFARGVFQYPEDRSYVSTDVGYAQYGSPSLLQSGKFALTFDDGPNLKTTPQVLDILKEYQVKATFFIVTSLVTPATLPLIKRMLDEGHLVASHGLVHINSNRLVEKTWEKRVKQSFIDLKGFYSQTGHTLGDMYYRFPFAAYGERRDYHHLNALKNVAFELTGKNCIQFAFWDIDSGDWIPGMRAAEIFQNIKSEIESGPFITYKTIRRNGALTQIKVHKKIESPLKGGTILFHDPLPETSKALKMILEYFVTQKLQTVRLDAVTEFLPKAECSVSSPGASI